MIVVFPLAIIGYFGGFAIVHNWFATSTLLHCCLRPVSVDDVEELNECCSCWRTVKKWWRAKLRRSLVRGRKVQFELRSIGKLKSNSPARQQVGDILKTYGVLLSPYVPHGEVLTLGAWLSNYILTCHLCGVPAYLYDAWAVFRRVFLVLVDLLFTRYELGVKRIAFAVVNIVIFCVHYKVKPYARPEDQDAESVVLGVLVLLSILLLQCKSEKGRAESGGKTKVQKTCDCANGRCMTDSYPYPYVVAWFITALIGVTILYMLVQACRSANPSEFTSPDVRYHSRLPSRSLKEWVLFR